MTVENLKEVLLDELRDLFDAEKQLVRALPKVARACEDEELRAAFEEHLEVTKGQVARLERVFEMCGSKAKSKPCHGMKGLVEEGQEIIQENHADGMADAMLVGAGRKVEHYEMAGYTSVIELARQLGMREAVGQLQETLKEEIETERLLATISKRLVKEAASRKGEVEMAEQGGGRGASRRGASRNGQQNTARKSSGGRSQAQSRSQGSGRAESRGRGSSQGRRGQSQAQGGGSRRGGSAGGGAAHALTDHEEIRRWAEERGAHPACVRGTGGKQDTGMIRIDFPGWSGEQSLEPIEWDQWFEKFDENGLALLVQDETSSGQKSNFNKLVSRATAESRSGRRPKVKRAGGE